MRPRLFIAITAAALLLLVSAARTDDLRHPTTVAFEEPVQVQGHLLSPGVYVFKLAAISEEHNIVQIWNADQTILCAIVMGFPTYVDPAPAEDKFIFEKAENGVPKVLKAWFQARNPWGEKFVYPRNDKD